MSRVDADAVRERAAEQPAGLGRIKGAAFREFLAWYAATRSRPRVLAAIRALDPDARELDVERRDFGVLQSAWYRAELVHGLLDLLTDGMPEEELRVMAQDAAIHVMNTTLRGVYKALFSWFATPQRYARHVHKLWRVHYDTGMPIVLTLSSNSHRVSFVEWAGHHPFICRLNMSAAVPVYSAMGCKNVSWTRLRCLSQGGDSCASLVKWDQ